MSGTTLVQKHPQDFVKYLKDEGIHRFYFVPRPKENRMVSSHPQLQPIAEFIQNDKRDFADHEGLFFQVCPEYDVLQGAFVHRTRRGQAAGGVRYWNYDTVETYLRDGLRLGKGMTRKNALAGLWWGGGKGVMARNPDLNPGNEEARASIYSAYGAFISSLRGCYVTAEDVGTCVADMAHIFSRTRFTTCIPEEWGGSGNPSVPTARGVICGMEAALEFLNLGELEGKTIAVQGMGNVGRPLIQFLFEKKVKKIYAADIDPVLVDKVRADFTGMNLDAKRLSPDDVSLFEAEVDIFSPNATGAVLNPVTIPLLRSKIVCGAANNQLEDAARDDGLLFGRAIVYVPDFLTNRMGIVNAANEQYGYVNNDPLFERHLERDWVHSIRRTTLNMLKESREKGEPTARITMAMADKLSMEEHPIFGHRGRLIIDSLVEDEWHHRSGLDRESAFAAGHRK